LENIN